MDPVQQQNSTGHGTVHKAWSEDVIDSVRDNSGISQPTQTKKEQKEQNKEQHEHSTGFGHTTQHEPSPRSIKRDLNNI